MKIRIAIIVACLGISLLGIRLFASGKPGNVKGDLKGSEPGFAVVELFTSEGCSSCPAADQLISRVQKESDGRPVYILAYHVDYWNRLGWKDPFSSAAYSHRQDLYANWLNASLYTPQAVVNGAVEFVGSDENRLRNALSTALGKPGKESVLLSHVTLDRDQVEISYHADGNIANTSLLVSLVQKTAVSKVLKGENGGRTLSHVQIVRDLETIDLNGKKDGTTTLKIPEGINADGYEIIAFLQNNRTGEITAAGKADLKPATGKADLKPATGHENNPYYSNTDTRKLNVSNKEWKKILPAELYATAREQATERPFTGKYWNADAKGTYYCAVCGNELFRSDAKFASTCGWPSFFAPTRKNSVAYREDHSYGMDRKEVICARCDSHLGHIFDDGPAPSHQRYCMNSISLDFRPDKIISARN